MIRFASCCSGIEAASVAWPFWDAAWFSEIEPFPCAVLKHHYPEVPNHGDMTTLPDRILSGEVEAPDVFCGGTPCQAFSVAGNRKSLDDARGNLSLTFCEIADAIDSVRYVRNAEPAIIFWENVPGVLNTPDNAFGCFLGKLAGEHCELQPPGGRWTDAGVVHGPKRAIAWRVLDAQYFGLAQRRRRVFLCAVKHGSRKGFNPSEVLFEFDSLRRDTAPSRQAGQGIAAYAESGFGQYREDSIAATSKASGDVLGGGSETFVCAEISPTVTNGPPFSRTGNERVECDALVTYGIQGNMIGRADTAGPQGNGFSEEVGYTLTKTDVHGVATAITTGHDQQVAVPLAFAQNQLGEVRASAEVFNTLNTNSNASGRNTAMVATQYAVRRLTPVECERLQGFPDGYTNIPWRNKPEAPDGPRYKALGNSWAVPVVRWIGERINTWL